MQRLAHLLGFSGTIGRWPFFVALDAAVLLFWLGIEASLAFLPTMAGWLAPRGINAAFALNAIWLLLGLAFCWAAAALIAKRLRTRGRSPWLAAAAVVPAALLALVNDAIFLVSRTFTLPPSLNKALVVLAAGVAIAVVVDCLRQSEVRA